MSLNIKAVTQTQGAEIVLMQLPCEEPARLVAELVEDVADMAAAEAVLTATPLVVRPARPHAPSEEELARHAAFVEKTKQFAGKPVDEQQSIALYGLVSEIGSLVAADVLGFAGPQADGPPGG